MIHKCKTAKLLNLKRRNPVWGNCLAFLQGRECPKQEVASVLQKGSENRVEVLELKTF